MFTVLESVASTNNCVSFYQSLIMDREHLVRLIAQEIPCEHLVVDSKDGVHFSAVIVSSAFGGLSRVERSRLVYAALGELMKEAVHAFSFVSLTPEEWKSQHGLS